MNMTNIQNAVNNDGAHELPLISSKMGRTTYDVHVYLSETSKETMTDKVIRLISNDMEFGSRLQA